MSGLVSVVIPNYNYGRYLKKAIQSVLDQDYPDIEIIVVDDGSTDDSISVLREFKNKIRIVETPNFGAPTARNFGVLASTGTYLAYLDSDDYWLSNKISSQVARLIESGDDLVYCQIQIIDEGNETLSITAEQHEGDFISRFIDNPTSTPFPPTAVLMTRALAARVGIWDTTLKSPAEDFDYFRRCAQYTKFSVVTEALAVHLEHPGSLTTMSLKRYFLDNRLALVKLFTDNYPKLSFYARRKSWIKLHFRYSKSFLRFRQIKMFLRCFLAFISPIQY